ncbi:MAG: hypothetical protein LBL93_06685 [Ruminococcus sp.]|jgi:hypothetical protein|nr:hypothetical protein [Ruminococcus sp.]
MKTAKQKRAAETRYIIYGLILAIPVFIGLLFAQMYLRAAFVGGIVIGLICIFKRREYIYEIGLCLFGYAAFAATLWQLFEPAEGIEFWVCILRLFNMTAITVTIFLLLKSKGFQTREFEFWKNPGKFYNIIECLLTVTVIFFIASFMAEWCLDFFARGGIDLSSSYYETGRETRFNIRRLVLVVILMFLELCTLAHLVNFIVKKGNVKHIFCFIICFFPLIWKENREEIKRAEDERKEMKRAEKKMKAITKTDNEKEPWEIG